MDQQSGAFPCAQPAGLERLGQRGALDNGWEDGWKGCWMGGLGSLENWPVEVFCWFFQLEPLGKKQILQEP